MGIEVDHEQIADFCRRWKITELSLFGSVLRDDFRPESDVDVLVRIAENYEPTLSDVLQMEDELRALFGREIDLVKRELVEANRNYIVRKHILRTAQPIYVG